MKYPEIVKKIVGEIKPIGESNTDNQRFENLKAMCNLIEDLFYEVEDIAKENIVREEFSMRRAGEYASNFIAALKIDHNNP